MTDILLTLVFLPALIAAWSIAMAAAFMVYTLWKEIKND